MPKPLLYASLAVIIALAVYALWPLLRPTPLVTEADNRDLLAGMATGQAAGLTAIAPTATAYATSTPTRTPHPATVTLGPTYGAGATPGIYAVARWTETPVDGGTVEAPPLPPCLIVTPDKYSVQYCEVPA